MEFIWGQFGGGRENGKTKNLPFLFVLKHGWDMDFLMARQMKIRCIPVQGGFVKFLGLNLMTYIPLPNAG